MPSFGSTVGDPVAESHVAHTWPLGWTVGSIVGHALRAESNAPTRHATLRGTTQRAQKWTIDTDWVLAATTLACVTVTELAWLLSMDLFFTKFANTSAAPSGPPATQYDEKQYLDIMFGSITFTCAHRQDKV